MSESQWVFKADSDTLVVEEAEERNLNLLRIVKLAFVLFRSSEASHSLLWTEAGSRILIHARLRDGDSGIGLVFFLLSFSTVCVCTRTDSRQNSTSSVTRSSSRPL